MDRWDQEARAEAEAAEAAHQVAYEEAVMYERKHMFQQQVNKAIASVR